MMVLKSQIQKSIRFDIQQSFLFLSILSVLIGISFILSQNYFSKNNTETLKENISTEPVVNRIAALGRLEPKGKIIHVYPANSSQRLLKLLVKEGDQVKANQLIAIMDDLKHYQALVENAKTRVNVFEAKLQQIKAGEKSGNIEFQRRKIAEVEAHLLGTIKSQQAVISQQEIELYKAKLTYKRYANLLKQGAVSQADTEAKQLQVAIEEKKLQEAKANLSEQRSTGMEQVKQAKATLESLMSIRSTDTAVAEAELEESRAQLYKAQIDLESAYVKAPITGQILSTNTQVSEVVTSDGIVDIGQTQQMVVMAEVYESDIQSVKVGQSATITSEYGGFMGELKGVVNNIKLKISKPGITSDDPSTKSDSRIIQVEINLSPEDSLRVRKLSNLQVRAFIKAD